MIVLDTNVLSEPMKASGNKAVLTWLDRQPVESLYLTAVSLSELLLGLELLPPGKQRQGLDVALRNLLVRLFGPRILPFDQRAAQVSARLVGRARGAGHAISTADGQIASIAEAHGFSVATRDTLPFSAAGVPVINPWMSAL